MDNESLAAFADAGASMKGDKRQAFSNFFAAADEGAAALLYHR